MAFKGGWLVSGDCSYLVFVFAVCLYECSLSGAASGAGSASSAPILATSSSFCTEVAPGPNAGVGCSCLRAGLGFVTALERAFCLRVILCAASCFGMSACLLICPRCLHVTATWVPSSGFWCGVCSTHPWSLPSLLREICIDGCHCVVWRGERELGGESCV